MSIGWERPKDPGFPCRLCGVRPDLDCPHRPADPSWSMGPTPPSDERKGQPRPGNGHNFKSRRAQIARNLKL